MIFALHRGNEIVDDHGRLLVDFLGIEQGVGAAMSTNRTAVDTAGFGLAMNAMAFRDLDGDP